MFLGALGLLGVKRAHVCAGHYRARTRQLTS
jgi:hypothetical protein